MISTLMTVNASKELRVRHFFVTVFDRLPLHYTGLLSERSGFHTVLG